MRLNDPSQEFEMTNTPKTKVIKDLMVSQADVGKIKSFLGIILKEIWLIKKREQLSQVGIENLRMIGVEAGRINELLPGAAK